MVHISLIIVHYNVDQDTKECLKSLLDLKADGFKYHVIVVDNASKKPFKLIQQYQDLGWEVLRSEANLGFTGGNNLGMRYALQKFNSDYCVLLNNDTIAHPHFLHQLFKYSQEHPEFGLISPKIYFARGHEFHASSYKPAERGQVLWYAGGTIDWANLTAFHRGVDEVDRGHFDHQQSSDFATGCCLWIKREVIETVGGLDDRFFLYLEDVDYCLRSKLKGYQIGFCSAAVVWHKNAGSTGGSGSLLQQYYQYRNRLWFFGRYGSWRTKLTVLRFGLELWLRGDKIQKRAVMDAALGRVGKQPIL